MGLTRWCVVSETRSVWLPCLARVRAQYQAPSRPVFRTRDRLHKHTRRVHFHAVAAKQGSLDPRSAHCSVPNLGYGTLHGVWIKWLLLKPFLIYKEARFVTCQDSSDAVIDVITVLAVVHVGTRGDLLSPCRCRPVDRKGTATVASLVLARRMPSGNNHTMYMPLRRKNGQR